MVCIDAIVTSRASVLFIWKYDAAAAALLYAIFYSTKRFSIYRIHLFFACIAIAHFIQFEYVVWLYNMTKLFFLVPPRRLFQKKIPKVLPSFDFSLSDVLTEFQINWPGNLSLWTTTTCIIDFTTGSAWFVN